MKRRVFQILGTIIPNTHFQAFAGKILYQGPLKGVCIPVFNCYACPLAIFSCPIGVIQHFAIIRTIPFYALGIIGMTGATIGRMSCGWFCPFGFMQDVMYKIRSFKIRIPKVFGYFKYVSLVGVAVIIPLLTGKPWFSKLCPLGTLEAGIPLAIASSEIRSLLGGFFILKLVILGVFLFLFVVSRRPFCVTTCPLGAIYSLFNRVSLVRLEADQELCHDCGICEKVCPTELKIPEELDSLNCIRCLDCWKECPQGAIKLNTWSIGEFLSLIERIRDVILPLTKGGVRNGC